MLKWKYNLFPLQLFVQIRRFIRSRFLMSDKEKLKMLLFIYALANSYITILIFIPATLSSQAASGEPLTVLSLLSW